MTAQPTATTHTLLRAEGFTCPSCVSKIEKSLTKLPGVTAASVHFATSRIEVDHDTSATSVDDVVAAIGKAGYTARPSVF
ncbi:MAG: heavy metal-associated domain-containing protein [Propionibacteriaceae bacterium]|nr:heavy metal-associated domain-containing protein [Propionibacteriaceae bacterium]